MGTLVKQIQTQLVFLVLCKLLTNADTDVSGHVWAWNKKAKSKLLHLHIPLNHAKDSLKD